MSDATKSATAETTSGLPTHYWMLHDAVNDAILGGARRSFSLEDVAPKDVWVALILSPLGHLLVQGAVAGALTALETSGATALDVERSPDASPGGAVTTADVVMVKGWLADALRRPGSSESRRVRTTDTLAARGWLNHPIRLTSLILAVFSVGVHSVDIARARTSSRRGAKVMQRHGV